MSSVVLVLRGTGADRAERLLRTHQRVFVIRTVQVKGRHRDGLVWCYDGVWIRAVDPGTARESLMTNVPSSRPTKAFWVQCIDRWPAEVLVYAEDAEAAKSLAAEDDGEEIRYGGECRVIRGALRDESRDRC